MRKYQQMYIVLKAYDRISGLQTKKGKHIGQLKHLLQPFFRSSYFQTKRNTLSQPTFKSVNNIHEFIISIYTQSVILKSLEVVFLCNMLQTKFHFIVSELWRS